MSIKSHIITLIILFNCTTSYNQIPKNFEIQSEYFPGLSRTKRNQHYKINIYNKNNRWKIYVNDGARNESTVFSGNIPENKMINLYNKLNDSLYVDDSIAIDTESCELTVIYKKPNNITLIGLTGENSKNDFKDTFDLRKSTITDFKPFHDKAEREIETIHQMLFSFAKTYADNRIAPTTENFHSDDEYSYAITSKSGKISLEKSINFFDEGFNLDKEFNFFNNKKQFFSTVDFADKNVLFTLPDKREIYIENYQLKVQGNKSNTLPICNYGNNFTLSKNSKYMVYEQKTGHLSAIECLYYILDINTLQITQILDSPQNHLDLDIDNDGNVYFNLNGEIYKWMPIY